MRQTLTLLAAVLTGLLLFSPGPVFARGHHNDIYCPAGTCATEGGPKARDLKYCSAKNCKKHATVHKSTGHKHH
jgi:hypothetical protein